MKIDAEQLLGQFIGSALGHSGRKKSKKAKHFLGGKGGLLNASTLLAGVGLAWGIYETMQGQNSFQGAQGAQGTQGAQGAQGAYGAQGASVVPPPLPGAAPALDVPPEVLRLIRLTISAARADGTMNAAERALILGHARDAGFESIVEAELASPHPLSAIVAGVDEPAQREDLYRLAFTIVRADDAVSGAERIYLAQLAHHLGLDAAAVSRLEADTAAKIDEAEG